MTSFALSSSCPKLKAIFTKCIIVIGSTWQRALASLSVAEVDSDVANFLMSTYDNFLRSLVKKMAPLGALNSLCSSRRTGSRIPLINRWLSCYLTSSTRSAQ